MLKYNKKVIYLPDLERSRPVITDAHKRDAALVPPMPVPFHCKPWVDGQTVGWMLPYGYLTTIALIGNEDGTFEVENFEQVKAESQVTFLLNTFAPGYFSFSTGYVLSTPPGMVSLIMPPTNPPAGLETLTAVVETDWFPAELFVVGRAPQPGQRIELDYGSELARIVVIPRYDNMKAEQLSAEAVAATDERFAAYRAEEATTPSRWKAATGDTFTHMYKEWSRRFLDKLRSERKASS